MVIKLARKIFYKVVGLNPFVDRLVRYRKPREYWFKRGGEGYFQEQEAVYDRTLRSQFIADEMAKLPYQSLLEVGCGYGKQLKNFLPNGTLIVGCDFSWPQLLKAKEYCRADMIKFVEADAEFLPFKDKSFDVVFSSAVILHNRYEKAKRIVSEMIRVSRRFLVHNEDTDVTFSRFGYDMKKTYEHMGFKIIKSIPIPTAPDPSITQFTVVELTPERQFVASPEVVLECH